MHRPDSIEIVDAKYKSHFAELNSLRWSALAEETQASMRADVHQVLAYVATAGSAEKISATLIYPVQRELYAELLQSHRTESQALIPVGSRQVTLRMQAIAFGGSSPLDR